MSKKDFIALADKLRGVWRDGMSDNARAAILEFCQEQNPRFKKERWLGYVAGLCGKNGGKVKASA